jgi:hypothetical protein
MKNTDSIIFFFNFENQETDVTMLNLITSLSLVSRGVNFYLLIDKHPGFLNLTKEKIHGFY